MAVPFHTQLQPFEEHQSPSPTEEQQNPYELALHRSRSPSYGKSPKRSPSVASNTGRNASPNNLNGNRNGPPSPNNTINTLQRQLSGDPDNPPPAWQRRPSVSTQRSRGSSVTSGTRAARSPSESSTTSPSVPSQPPSASRRHPNLRMTTTTMAPLPNAMFLHESPSGSSTSLADDPPLMLPQPAFRRRPGGSTRSSISSSQDLSTLTSEELWTLEQETGVSGNAAADQNNPYIRAEERPLDTVRRMSSRIEHSPYRNGLPGDVIWPTAAPEEIFVPPRKNRSVTSMASLRGSGKKGTMSRRGSRQASMDLTNAPVKLIENPAVKSMPTSPQDTVMISSNNSSSTSLASHGLPPNKSNLSLGARPPSAYYSRDFLSSLAPREGGYAIAAQMGNGLGAVGTMSVDERRRSTVYEGERPRSMARAPMSKSSGMGRWSLDGGEHYGKPYGTPSNATTSSSFFGAAGSSNEVSPPADDESGQSSYLPEGASAPAAPRASSLDAPSIPAQTNSVPVNPSPLSQNTAADDLPSPALPIAAQHPASQPDAQTTAPPPVVAPLPIPAAKADPKPAAQTLNTKKSKKELAKDAKIAAKEAKAAEKAAAAKVALKRAQDARDAAAKRQADKDALKKKKEDDKRKEKEEKERKKAEKKAGLKTKLKNSSVIGFQRSNSATPSVATTAGARATTQDVPPVPPVPPIPAGLQNGTAAQSEFGAKPAAVPFPRSQSAQGVPQAEIAQPRTTAKSMPLGAGAPAPTTRPAPTQTASLSNGTSKSRMGMFGTLKKRLSIFGDLKEPPSSPSTRGSPAKASQLSSIPPTPPKEPRAGVGAPGTPAREAVETVSTPVRPSTPSTSTPEPLANLPPRSSSRPDSSFATPGNDVGGETPTPTPAKIERSTSRTSTPSTHATPLTKVLSHGEVDRTGSPSSSASARKGGSIRGPRPMPRTSVSPTPEKARPSSIGHAPASTNAPYPMVTPSVSGESGETTTETETGTTAGDSLFSNNGGGKGSTGTETDLASPYTSEGGNGDSRKGSFSAVNANANAEGGEGEGDEREGSNETVTEALGAETAPPVQLGQVVAAH